MSFGFSKTFLILVSHEAVCMYDFSDAVYVDVDRKTKQTCLKSDSLPKKLFLKVGIEA